MPEKHTKASVDYTPKAENRNERCELCAHFIEVYGQCSRVAGEIKAAGWCRLFERES